jgi:hypothetical protein
MRPPLQWVDPGRAQFRGRLTQSAVDDLAADRSLTCLQVSEPVDLETLALLDSQLFRLRPDVEFRVYGHYNKICDLSFLACLPHLRRLAADHLTTSANVEFIAGLGKLESLSVGIFELQDFNFLKDVKPDSLRSLSIGWTRSKKPDLRIIERFSQLEQLYIEGHRKNIEVVGRLSRIRDLTLRSITLPSLGFLHDLPNLLSLDLKLGGVKGLNELADLKQLRYLELWQVRGVADLAPVSDMTGLQFMFLQSLPHIAMLPDLSRLTALRRLHLDNMKGLKDLSPLASAPALEDFVHISAKGLDPDDFRGLLGLATLKRVFVGFGSLARNQVLERMAVAAGIEYGVPREAFRFI